MMNEIIGEGRDREPVYTVASVKDQGREFTNPADAAKAFYELPAADHPVVVRADEKGAQFVAQTAGESNQDGDKRWKYVSDVDPALKTAFEELTQRERASVPARDAIEGNALAKDLADHLQEEARMRSEGKAPTDPTVVVKAAEIAIATRAELHENALFEAKKPELAEAAPGDVNAKLAIVNRRDVEVVSQETATTWAKLDAEDFRKLDDDQRAEAALAMAGISSARYKAALRETAPEIADQVQVEEEKFQKSIADKENDALQEQRDAQLRRDLATGRDAVLRATGDGELGEDFVKQLDERMADAELKERGWRDRDDIKTVMEDLERLAGQNWRVAADLWDKHRPDDIDKPVFIDGDDVDEKGPRADGEKRADTTQPSASETKMTLRGVTPEQLADAGLDVEGEKREEAVPSFLRKRYLQADDKFYFRDEDNKLAFEVKGKRMLTEHNDPEVARSMVELAASKGWTSVKLKGAEEFKREAWLQASLKGMDVQGFKPKDVDLARLEDMRKEQERLGEKGGNSIERTPDRRERGQEAGDRAAPAEATGTVVDEPRRTLSDRQQAAVMAMSAIMRARGDSEQAVAAATDVAIERFQTNRVYVGRVEEHGAARYEHDPKNEMSYFVKLKTDSGEKVVWGVDLERAVGEHGAKVGDDVAIAYQGRKPVTVMQKQFDEAGNVTGHVAIETNRNTWYVSPLDRIREEARDRLEAVARSADREPLMKVYDREAPRATPRPTPGNKEVEREQGPTR